MDNDFDYSSDAIENKAAFFDKNYTVYVEGSEDILFWDNLFQEAGIDDFHIEDVGGSENLEPYIDEIIQNDLNVIVACDNDYSSLDNSLINNDKIIYTYGFSIENSMYRTEKINEVIQYLAKKRADIQDDIEQWKLDFEERCETLLIYDYANHKFNKGITVLGLNSCTYLVNNSSKLLCDTKINKALEKIKGSINEEEFEEAKNELEASSLNNWFHIRGHFLSNAVYNLIKSTSERMSGNNVCFSMDALYAMTVNCAKYKTQPDIEPLILNIINADKKIRK